MQWMTVTSYALCYALHAPQSVAVSLSEPFNQYKMPSAPITETVLVMSKYTGFSLE